MALYSKKEFADLCGVATNYLAVIITRKKVELTGELIDDSLPKNAAFLQKRKAKIEVSTEKPAPKPPIIEHSAPAEIEKSAPPMANDRDKLSYAELEKQKKLADLIKTETDTEHRRLQIQKIIGESIPTVMVKGVVSTLSQTIVASFKDGADSFIIEISKRKQLTGAEVAELRGELVTIINNSTSKAVNESKKRIKAIVNEYSEKREVGEHD